MGPDDTNYISVFHQSLGEDRPVVEAQQWVVDDLSRYAVGIVINLDIFFAPEISVAEKNLQIARSFVGAIYTINKIKEHHPRWLATRAETKAFQGSL